MFIVSALVFPMSKKTDIFKRKAAPAFVMKMKGLILKGHHEISKYANNEDLGYGAAADALLYIHC